MANPEHLAILKKGAQAWNEWRKGLRGIKLDFSHANLSRATLSGANLVRADLSGANLYRADLRDVILSGANLSGANLFHANLPKVPLARANLSSANLARADLRNAILRDANLVRADFRNAELSSATLFGANLVRADLSGANLSGANLSGANLSGADLSGANLSSANLSGANLSGAKLPDADLSGKNLSSMDLSGANLSGADLRSSQLVQCNLTGATLTGARLYGTARDNWIIQGVECRYVFWDDAGRIRSPTDRDLAPGEFEQLYRSLPTIEYVFQNGMTPLDPLIMDRVVQAIREQNPEYDIKIDSISARGLAPSIKFTVHREEQNEAALAEVTKVYEAKLQEFAGRLDEARAFIQLLIDRPNPVYIGNATAQYLAIGGSTINIDQHVEYITNLRDAVAALPEDSPTFAKKTKKAALDIIGDALKDVAKGQVKKAAEQIIELGKDLGPVILETAAYGFFKSRMPGG